MMRRRAATLLLSLLLCTVYAIAASEQVAQDRHDSQPSQPFGTFWTSGPFGLLPVLRRATLIRFGALVTPPVWPGVVWRLLSAPLLHVDAQHLAVNLVLLLLFAGSLEPHLGRRRCALLFVLGGLAGSLGSLLGYYRTPSVCAGSSAAVLALLVVAIFGTTGRATAPVVRLAALLAAAGLLLSGVIGQGDNAAHLGGLLAGLVSLPITRPTRRDKSSGGAAAVLR